VKRDQGVACLQLVHSERGASRDGHARILAHAKALPVQNLGAFGDLGRGLPR
jgi:hypothetical protein